MPEPTNINPAKATRRRRWLRAGVAVTMLAVLGYLLASGVDKVREAAERAHCNLSQVALAFHSYHDKHGGLPPAAIRGRDGTPLLSWRVLLLPYLEQQELYDQFQLDEPWDSPHNAGLLPRMPQVYAPPGRKAAKIPPHHTTLKVFVGRGTPFEEKADRRGNEPAETTHTFRPPAGPRLSEDFPDGTENTLLFAEAGEPVPWTKPEELPYDPAGPLPDLRCLFRGGFRACMLDASRRFIRTGTTEATLRALITRNGGDQPGEFE